MKRSFAGIGLELQQGHRNNRWVRGWTIGSAVNFTIWQLGHIISHMPTLRQVDSWWRHKAAYAQTERAIMKALLERYRTASTDDLEAIWRWAERTSPVDDRPESQPGVPVWLTDLLGHHWDCGRFSCRPRVERDIRPSLPRGWRPRVAVHHIQTKNPDGRYKPRRRTIYQRMAWLCERACRERLRDMPPAIAAPKVRRHL